jgi:hypothetical protein
MSTDTAQVMRVVDRCLDTARFSSGTSPDMAAAAARAKADPQMHQAIAALLATTAISTWTCWQHAMTAAREARTAGFRDLDYSCPENHDTAEPTHYTVMLDEHGSSRCDEASFARIFTSCKAASRDTGATDSRTPAALAELVLSAVAVEKSSLGTDHSRRMRNRTAHGDVLAAIRLSHQPADHKPATGN